TGLEWRVAGDSSPVARLVSGSARERSTGPAPGRSLRSHDLLEILEKHLVELGLLLFGLAAQHRRQMIGRDGLRRIARLRELAAVARDPELVAENHLRGGGTEADEHVRLDQRQLRFEPRAAGAEFRSPRRLVDAALAALLDLEVLDGVGDVELLARQTGFGERLLQHLTRRPDERRTLPVFVVSRLLADEDDAGAGRASAEHGLRRVAIEIAALAMRRCFREFAESRLLRHERRRTLAFCGDAGLVRDVLRREQRVKPSYTGI